MAELTMLESKVGEVIGLAQAAKDSTKKIAKLVKDPEIGATLKRMTEEAAETERRTKEIAGEFTGKKSAIMDEAKTTKAKATEIMSTYLDEDADALDGLEFLTMAEAAETGHWEVLQTMNRKAGNARLQEVTDFVLPIQQRHLQETRSGLQKLAAEEDPNQEA